MRTLQEELSRKGLELSYRLERIRIELREAEAAGDQVRQTRLMQEFQSIIRETGAHAARTNSETQPS